MSIIYFDDETRSEVPIEHGRVAYMRGKDADMICMGYRVGLNSPTKLWRPGMRVPEQFAKPAGHTFVAFNIKFDQHVTNVLGRFYGMGRIQTNQCVDIMAIAARYGLPQSLDKLCKALGVKQGKLAIGKALKKLLCVPPYHNPKKDLAWHAAQRKAFYEYCIRDVDSMCDALSLMPSSALSKSEQHIWQVTSDMNDRGVPVDVVSVAAINIVIDIYMKKKVAELAELTDREITTPYQTQRMQKLALRCGVTLENVQVDTVKSVVVDLQEELDTIEMSEKEFSGKTMVVEMLKIRQLIGGAAIKKFKRLANMAVGGIIHDNARYHGAGTGRNTGGGFQMLNLPRAKTPHPEELLKKFKDRSILHHKNPLGEAKKLVRPMLKAPDKKVLMASDYASIEYILIMEFAGETEKVERFGKGFDPYMDYATKLFHVDYADVTDDQRQKSKPPILGGQYMLSGNALIDYAAGYGVYLKDGEGHALIQLYRSDHQRVVKSWYALKEAAQFAVANVGTTRVVYNTTFRVINDRKGRAWLRMTLPSGRNLFYCQPKLVDGKYGKVIKHRGINPKNKQWGWVYLPPQRLIENIIQSLGRDILQYGVDKLLEHNFNIIFTVYDEIACIEDEDGCEDRFKLMNKLMCMKPDWCKNMPLRSDGFIGKRYKKH